MGNKKQKVIDLNSIVLSIISEKRFLSEELMSSLIQREQIRVIRSFQSLCIMSIDCGDIAEYFHEKIPKDPIVTFFNRIKKIEENIRECDIIGWIKKNETIGIVFIDVQKNCTRIIEKKIIDIYKFGTENYLPELEIKTLTYPIIINCENTFREEISLLENLKKKSRSMNQE